jgi:hypothetical protein
VASRYRNLDLNKVDFAFGGSTLQMLATLDTSSDPYIVTKVAGTKTILVVKKKEYTQNIVNIGFQFERYVTGKKMSDTSSELEFVEHMHLTKVGAFKVLFRAEVDAQTSSGYPVEVTASNPHYWGTKVLFQMISNGSTKLCHGEKYRGALAHITLQDLSQVSKDALEYTDVRVLQRNILKGMNAIKAQLEPLVDGEIRRISFSGGSLKLLPTSSRTSAILPSNEVVKSLL